MVNALQVSELGARETCQEENQGKVFGLASAAPVAPGTAESAVCMVVLSVPLPDWAGAQGARS